MTGRLAWVIPASLVVLTAAACDTSRDGGAVEGGSAESRVGTATFCTQGRLSSLNPFVSADVLTADLRALLFTPLVRYGGGRDFQPYLARGWRWNEEGTEVVFELRSDVLWHDGTRLTAGDVAWTIEAASDTSYAYLGSSLAAVRDVSIVDSTHVRLLFDKPFVPGVEPFAHLPILPRHLLAGIPPERFSEADYNRAPVGSGPFRFLRRLSDGALVFEPFDSFPEALGRPSLNRIVIREVPEASTIGVELRTGTVDLCEVPTGTAELLARSGVEVIAFPPEGPGVLPLNTESEILGDARVRRAVSAALDRSEIASVKSRWASPATTFLPAGSPWLAPEWAQPDNDTTLAAALLDSAGWTDRDRDGIRRNGAGTRLEISLVGPTPTRDFMTQIQSHLRRVGILASVRALDAATFYGLILDPATRPDAMLLSFAPELIVYPDPTSELHSSGDVNVSGYAQPAVDSLLANLQLVANDQERGAIYRDLQRHIARDVPIVYILHDPRTLAVGSRMDGVHPDANGPFSSVNDWQIR